MKLLNTEETKWDKNIKLELTLRELQIIRDSIGTTTHGIRKGIWVWENCTCPYGAEQGQSLFNDVNYILKEQGGVVFE